MQVNILPTFFTTSYSGEVTAIKVRKNDSEVSRHYDL